MLILGDGKWHTFTEIQRKMCIEANQIDRIIEFLIEYSFATIDGARRRVKLDKATQKFLRRVPSA